MAIAHLHMKVGKAGKAGAHAAYITRTGRYANRLNRGEKLEATDTGNMPAWAKDNPKAFWDASDLHERKNGSTYREMEIALPRELTPEQRLALVMDFVRQELGDKHAYQWAIHTPKAVDGNEQPHVHIMFSERQNDGIERSPEQYFKRYNSKNPEKGGARKGYGPNAGKTLTPAERAEELKALRGRWEALCNNYLERAGQEIRIDMRSYADRNIDLIPEKKQLPSQWRGDGKNNIINFRKARAERSELKAIIKSIGGHKDKPTTPKYIRAYQAETIGDEVHYKRMAGGNTTFVDKGLEIDIIDRTATHAALVLASKKWPEGFTVQGSVEFKALCRQLATQHGYKILNPELQGQHKGRGMER